MKAFNYIAKNILFHCSIPLKIGANVLILNFLTTLEKNIWGFV